jgi:hypothetical protein
MKITCTLLALSFIAVPSLFAQGGQQQPQHDRPRGHRPPPLPVMLALDVNGDRVIDANEIANASAALKQLDKNGDGQLTDDETCPPRPEGGLGQGQQGNGGNQNQPRPGGSGRR